MSKNKIKKIILRRGKKVTRLTTACPISLRNSSFRLSSNFNKRYEEWGKKKVLFIVSIELTKKFSF